LPKEVSGKLARDHVIMYWKLAFKLLPNELHPLQCIDTSDPLVVAGPSIMPTWALADTLLAPQSV
jgi:hypothetical protein